MWSPLRRFPATLLALLLLAPLAACDSGDPEPEPELRLVNGVSLARIFEAPSASEIDAVRAEWAARTPTAEEATVVGSAEVEGATVYVVSHTMYEGPGAPFTHYGAVRIPEGLDGEAPVLVVHHGGDGGFAISGSGANGTVAGFAALYPTLAAQTVQVYPTYRSEPLGAGVGDLAVAYTSGGTASPWDYDVDDSIALLSTALDLFDDATDEDRVAALGFSRGANTALLHQARDDRVDAVTEYYGPADFFNDTAALLAAALLSGDTGVLGLPGAPYLLDEVLRPLSPDGAYNADADYAGARLEVIRRSASLFKSDLANVQVHHHVGDPVVPYPFSQAFDAAAGSVSGDYELNAYSNTTPNPHSPEGLPASQSATEAWLLDALGVTVSTLTEASPVLF